MGKYNKGKPVCNGGHYAQWYMSFKVNCKLAYKKRYRIQCRSTAVGGWAGGYLSVRKKICAKNIHATMDLSTHRLSRRSEPDLGVSELVFFRRIPTLEIFCVFVVG